MMLLQRGSRLSIQPVSLLQWQIITNIAANKGSGK
jgi:predicted RNA-binding protein with PUA-like domain